MPGNLDAAMVSGRFLLLEKLAVRRPKFTLELYTVGVESVANKRKYKTAKQLEKGVQRYISKNSRIVQRTQEVWSGELDDKGHKIMLTETITAEDGSTMEYRAWGVPPNVGGLCRELGISRQTWTDYCNPDKHPEFQEIVQEVQDIMQTWLEEELLTRPDKELKGIIFNLENNYRYRNHVEVHGISTMEDLLGIGKEGQDKGAEQDAVSDF